MTEHERDMHLLDIFERAEEADEAMQVFWPDLEAVVSDDILANMKTVITSLHYINRLSTKALGGAGRLCRLRDEREERENEEQ